MTSRTALIIGGAGQVGRAACRSLLADGWAVSIAHRSVKGLAGVESISLDRNDDEAMAHLLNRGFDVVIDLVAFRPEHATQLLRHSDSIGSAIVLSTAAVYLDSRGLTLMDAGEDDTTFPSLVLETSKTVEPSNNDYPGRKRSVEALLLESDLPTTILRPAAIHGPHSPQPREWFHVRRLLENRQIFVHGFEGKSSLHPASVYNIAEVIRLAAGKPGSRILNVGDPDEPNELSIARAIARSMRKDVTHILLPGPAPVASPWSLRVPFFLSLQASVSELGYRPVSTYADTVKETCEWLIEANERGVLAERLDPRFGGPGVGFMVMAGLDRNPFNYLAEDRLVCALGGE
jgi:nucleoside-diphosphate-sugar epimerase